MSIATVITGGIGPGATIPLLITKGYGIGEAVTPTPTRSRGGYLPPKKGRRRKPEWQEKDERREELRAAIEQAYNAAMGIETPEVVEAIAPFVTTKRKPRKALPRPRRVDFTAMTRDLDTARRILDKLQAINEDEDAASVLLLGL